MKKPLRTTPDTWSEGGTPDETDNAEISVFSSSDSSEDGQNARPQDFRKGSSFMDMRNEQPEKKRAIRPNGKVKILVTSEFVGTQSMAEAFIPIICEDLRRKADTFDRESRIA